MKKVAIITTFQEFNLGYSLTGIVSDQIKMLTEYGHEVHLFVCSQFNEKMEYPKEAILHKSLPFAHLTDYSSITQIKDKDKDIIRETKLMLIKELYDIDIVFTHDFVFIGWYLIYGEACRQASPHLPKAKWMHWIHSMPTSMRDWWDIKKYSPAHKLIFPNHTERLTVAEQFRGAIEDVRAIHHIKDLRTWWDFCEDSCNFIKQYPALMQNEIVQIYPASVDRLEAKRVREVIWMFSFIKKAGISVCLVIASQWATGKKQKKDIDLYKKFGAGKGLEPGKDLIFTSDFKSPTFDIGIPKRMLRELQLCSNVFIFPTKEESFGLVLPEVCLSGVIPVLNKSLDMMKEISGGNGLFHDFGSFSRKQTIEDPKVYYKDLATILVGRFRENESMRSKTFMRMRYNWDYLYQREYAPLMAESEMWV